MKNKQELVQALTVTAEVMGRELSTSAVMMMVNDLDSFNLADLGLALTRLRKEGGRFTVAEIIKRIPGMWPNSDEAWAMVPRSESETACLCAEIFEGRTAAQGCGSDHVAARMAFKGAYERAVAVSTAQGKKPDWQLSLGHDSEMHETVADKYLALGLLTPKQVNHLLPEIALEKCEMVALGKTYVAPKQIENKNIGDTIRQLTNQLKAGSVEK